MKMKSFFICALACSLSGIAHAGSCISDDPAIVAKSFYDKHKDFHYTDPEKIQSLVVSRFYAALENEYKCAQGQVCAIDADPWTDAQDGEIENPISFKVSENTGTRSLVKMNYSFSLDDSRKRPRSVELKLERNSDKACWLVSDLVTPRGQSLVQHLEKWQKEFGEAQ